MSKVAFAIEVPNVLRGTPLELKFVETARQVIQERTVIRKAKFLPVTRPLYWG